MKPNQLSAITWRILATFVTLTGVAASLIAQTAPAASPAATNDSEITTLSPFVVVSENETGYRTQQTLVGSRTAKNLMDIAASVSIINRQQIDDLNAVEVHEVLQFGVAGVTQNQTINDDVNIRGFRTTFSLRNGVTKTGFKRNPMFDVERVEVIKGPGAMLLGNNSFLGGGVNFVSRKASSQKTGELQLTFGGNSYVRMAANMTGPLYKSNDVKFDYRLTLGALSADTDRDIENEDQQFLGGGLALYFGSSTSILANAYYFKDDGYFYWEDFLDYSTTLGTTTSPLMAKLNNYSSKSFSAGRSRDAYWDNQDVFVDVTFLNKLSDNANLRLYYFGGTLVDRRRIVRGITITADNRTLLRQDIPLRIDNVTHNFQGDFTHQWKTPSFTLDSTLGADIAISYQRQDQSVNSMPSLDTSVRGFPADDAYFAVARPGAGTPNLSQNITRPVDWSYYFQENLSFLRDKLILVGGLRWFIPGGNNKNNITGVVTDRPNKDFKTHKFGIVLRPIPALSLYATDSENAFPQIGRTDRFAGNDQLGAPLSTQEGKMKEYGLKLEHKFSEGFSAYGSVAYYDMSLTNVRTFGVLPEGVPPGSIGVVQSEADLAQGWEFEYGLRFGSTAGALDLIGTYANGDSQTAADKRLKAADFVPTKSSLMARYGWNNGPLKGLSAGVSYFDQSTKRNANYWIDFPATYNLFARYAWRKNWSFQVNLNNITDERYIVAIAANGLVQTEPGFDGKFAVKYSW